MEFDFAFLADKAQTEGGKLFVMGGIVDILSSKSGPPITHDSISLVTRILCSDSEVEKKSNIKISIIDENKVETFKKGSEFTIPKNPDKPIGWKHGFLIIVEIKNLKFDKCGNYTIKILLNDIVEKNIPLYIRKV